MLAVLVDGNGNWGGAYSSVRVHAIVQPALPIAGAGTDGACMR